MNPDISIVIPVFNEEDVLPELHRRLTASLVQLRMTYELIFVDDGSRDRSFARMQALEQQDPDHVHILRFSRNFGHHIALTAGLDHARGNLVTMMDADLQDQPEELHKLIEKMSEGYDVVWADRQERQHSNFKNLTSRIFNGVLNRIVKMEVPLNSSIFRVMTREVADELRSCREQARYLPGLISWLGYRQISTPVEHGKRFAGETKYSLWRLIKLALHAATSFTAAPLQVATLIGLVAAGFALLFLVYIVLRKVFGTYHVLGYASIMFSVLFFGALQLIVLGLMGEYISRIYSEAQARPLYLLRELGNKMTRSDRLKSMDKEPRFLHSPVEQQEPSGTLEKFTLRSLSEQDCTRLVDVLTLDPELSLKSVLTNWTPEALAKFHLQTWKNADAIVYCLPSSSLTAVAIVHELPWDTGLLGLKARRIAYANVTPGIENMQRASEMEKILLAIRREASEEEVKLLDAKVSSKDPLLLRSFERAGFHSVDVLVTLGVNREGMERILTANHIESWEQTILNFPNGVVVRPIEQKDAEAMQQLSFDAFGETGMIQSRFFVEASIDPNKARALYRQWFSNLLSMKNRGEAEILVATLEGNAVGYLAIEPMEKNNPESYWKDSLNAVQKDARGFGVYKALVLASIQYVYGRGGAGLFTKTQNSTFRVINTWLHMGVNICESNTTLHWTPNTYHNSI